MPVSSSASRLGPAPLCEASLKLDDRLVRQALAPAAADRAQATQIPPTPVSLRDMLTGVPAELIRLPDQNGQAAASPLGGYLAAKLPPVGCLEDRDFSAPQVLHWPRRKHGWLCLEPIPETP